MSKSPAIIQAAEARADILRDLGADPAALVASLRAGYATNPDLGACAPQSVIACLYAVAQSGLLLGGPQPHVYLIPRGQVCTLQLGYHGALELARRHGGLASVRTGVIYE
ncbi:MAG: hypothetical protein GY873_20290, partial [Bosea sp.]|uniref:recombinase RecT n=1 Tax=Bosea sp. (in: a-proteobacteria) TaxID=1871050 RepID=UPI002390615C|nr:hypothetical protein [Bosea sp. (in: a-proteobacteria)]